ncbi:MAG: hypothetical protein ACW986_11525 [Promethearchaeota archaeon]|jgi:hypothetical protein
MATLIGIVELTLIAVVSVALICSCFLVNNFKGRSKNVQYSAIVSLLLFVILLTVLVVMNGIEWFIDDSLHLGLILGLPALICITTAMVLVLYDESTFVFWHGLLGISAWTLTLLNVISLFWMPQAQVFSYSGLTHFIHIMGGGGGLAAGFANALFGASGQRKVAKYTGFITMGCWWGAFLLGLIL